LQSGPKGEFFTSSNTPNTGGGRYGQLDRNLIPNLGFNSVKLSESL